MDLGTGTTMKTMPDRWRSMRRAKRVGRLDEENDRLRTELRMTKSQLEHERELELGVLDALNRASERKTEVAAQPRGGLLRLVIVGGAAYVFGTKAGLLRYEQIRSWFSSKRSRITASLDLVDTSSPGMGPRPNPLTESGIRRMSHTGLNLSTPRSA